MAEIKLPVLTRQCLFERMNYKTHLQEQGTAWHQRRNASPVTIDWRFTTDDARIRLKKLYPATLPS